MDVVAFQGWGVLELTVYQRTISDLVLPLTLGVSTRAPAKEPQRSDTRRPAARAARCASSLVSWAVSAPAAPTGWR